MDETQTFDGSEWTPVDIPTIRLPMLLQITCPHCEKATLHFSGGRLLDHCSLCEGLWDNTQPPRLMARAKYTST